MISKALEIFAKSIGLKAGENSVYGIYGEYLVSVSEQKTKKIVEISCFIGNSEEYSDDYMELNDSLREVIDRFVISDYKVSTDGIRITTSGSISFLRELVDYVIGMLNEKGIPDSKYCSLCGKEFSQGEKRRIVTVSSPKGEHKSILCQNCSLEISENATGTEEDEEEKSPSRKKGVVFGLIASLLFAAIYVLVFYFAGVCGYGPSLGGYFACLIGLFIGGGTFCMYKFGSKVLEKTDLIIISVATAVFSVAAHIIGCLFGWFSRVAEVEGLNFSHFFITPSSYFKTLFTDSANLRFFIIGGIACLCAAFVAIIFAYGLRSSKNSKKNNVNVSITTIK